MEQDYQSKDEIKVGITEYISQGGCIPALTKYMFSDFIVNQIDKQEKLVSLSAKPSMDNIVKINYQPNYEVSEELAQKMKDVLGEEASQSIRKLYEQLECGEKVPAWEVVVEKDLDKEERKKVHDFVREELHLIESLKQDGSRLKLKYNRNLRKMDPKARQKYIHFTLYKHGIDTFNAIFRLSRATYISQKLFSTAGLKDKRGYTTQRVSLYNTDLQSLLKFYKQAYRNKQMWISDFTELQDEKVQVGGLSGNQFGLVLRLINKEDADEAIKRVESLKEKGMINYFGLQRFGQFATKTYEIGVLYARKQWKTLVESILLSDCNNESANNIKRQIYESKKFAKAEKALHNKYKIQKMLFKALSRLGENHQNAFESLPRSVKSLYTHSLQSYIWNRIASRRLRERGLVLCEGDMVGKKVNAQVVNEKQNEPQEEIIPDLVEDEAADEEEFQALEVTADNINQYSITDLILPLLGPQIQLKENSWLQNAVTDELKALNLTEADFSYAAKAQNARAAWRKMLVKPEVLDYEIISHKAPKDELASPFYTIGEKLQVQEGDLRSVRVVIRLPKSAYATMAIREMFHIGSSFDVQKKLNGTYEQKYAK